ncbi:MAG: RAD55 family ATPase [Planctomycetota bacterium]
MSAKRVHLKKIGTGQPELDAILGGGVPERSLVVVAGEPGSGKTVLTLQTLFAAARAGKKALYVTTLSEPAVKLVRYMQQFEFFDLDLVDESVHFADIAAATREGGDAALDAIASLTEKHQASVVAVDSFRPVTESLVGPGRARAAIHDLALRLAGAGATTFLVGEYTRDSITQAAEFAIADGIVFLGSERQELTALRDIEVVKMRGAAFVSGKHFLEINKEGVAVYPRVRAPAEPAGAPDLSVRASTGVPGLDDLLGGGLPRGSATVIEGATGTGKTLLGLRFLIEGAKRGERGVLFTQEETPDQIRSVALALGWNLAELEKKKLFALRYSSPVEMSTDLYLHRARIEAETLGARRAVFDSLTTMSLGVPSHRRFKELVYSIAKHMCGAGVTSIMTLESPHLLGAASLSGPNVSFIADNLIQLRYVETDGRLDRAISVLKCRGVRHGSELRAYSIESDGPRVSTERFKDARGVLTGRSPEEET